jgi:hypothetical protein
MELYWLLRLPHLQDFCYIILILLFVAFSVASPGYLFGDDEDKEMIFKLHKWCILIAIFLGVIAILCPTKTDLALMMGWDALKSDSVQEVIEILKDKIKD